MILQKIAWDALLLALSLGQRSLLLLYFLGLFLRRLLLFFSLFFLLPRLLFIPCIVFFPSKSSHAWHHTWHSSHSSHSTHSLHHARIPIAETFLSFFLLSILINILIPIDIEVLALFSILEESWPVLCACILLDEVELDAESRLRPLWLLNYAIATSLSISA